YARPDAYERLVDRLLASPRYGERWARTWLDLAGYADSEGKREQDVLRPYAWRYRDYVIRAFNADKPYDRFLREQIAGDELDEYDWLKPDVRPGLGPISQDVVAGRLLPHVTTAERRAWEAHDADIRRQIEAIKAPLDRKAEALTAKIVDERLAKLPAVLHADL